MCVSDTRVFLNRLRSFCLKPSPLLDPEPQLFASIVVRLVPQAVHHPEIHAHTSARSGATSTAVVDQRSGFGTFQSALHQSTTSAIPTATLIL